MSQEIIKLVEELLDMNANIHGVALIKESDGSIIHQTENWDVGPDTKNVLAVWTDNPGSVSVLGIKYMVVENTPERIVGTNVTGKGHVIGVSAGPAKMLCYISPATGPREVLQDLQLQAGKIAAAL